MEKVNKLHSYNSYISYLRKIMPIRDIVAGDAQLRSCVSNRKLTFGPNWILSPDGMVSRRLSSNTEFRDSIHSGSMSPSHTIHDWVSVRMKICKIFYFDAALVYSITIHITGCQHAYKMNQ